MKVRDLVSQLEGQNQDATVVVVQSPLDGKFAELSSVEARQWNKGSSTLAAPATTSNLDPKDPQYQQKLAEQQQRQRDAGGEDAVVLRAGTQ